MVIELPTPKIDGKFIEQMQKAENIINAKMQEIIEAYGQIAKKANEIIQRFLEVFFSSKEDTVCRVKQKWGRLGKVKLPVLLLDKRSGVYRCRSTI